MKGEIDLTADQRQIVLELIERHLPDTDVWAYGSRVKWTSRPESDLDLVVFSGADQSGQVADLREAFEESDLPFRVDVLVWDDLSEPFCRTIDDEHAVLLEHRGHSYCHDDHPLVPIGDIMEVVGGGTPSTKDPSNFDGPIPWLTPRDLAKPHYRYVSGGARTLSRQGLRNSSAHIVPKDTVLLSTRAPIGYTAIAACPLATNQGFRNLLPSDRISSAYLYYWLTANVPELQRHATGSTFAELSARSLKAIRIPLPPVSVQRRLTQVLEILDDQIDVQRRMVATLDSTMFAVFRDWFDSTLLRTAVQDSGRRLHQGSPGQVGQYYRVTMGQSPPGDSYNDKGDGEPFLQGSAEFGFRFPSIRRYCTNPTRLVSRNETLISVRAPVGAINMAKEETCIGRGLAGIVHKSGARSFTYYAIKTMQAMFQRHDQEGTIFGSITKKQIQNLPVQEPSRQLIDAFESTATNFDDCIRSAITESQILANIRDTLLAKMFCGCDSRRTKQVGHVPDCRT